MCDETSPDMEAFHILTLPCCGLQGPIMGPVDGIYHFFVPCEYRHCRYYASCAATSCCPCRG